jgi:hypothetical protein
MIVQSEDAHPSQDMDSRRVVQVLRDITQRRKVSSMCIRKAKLKLRKPALICTLRA